MENLEARIVRAEEIQRELDELKAETMAERDELHQMREDARRRARVLTTLMGRPASRRPRRHDFDN